MVSILTILSTENKQPVLSGSHKAQSRKLFFAAQSTSLTPPQCYLHNFQRKRKKESHLCGFQRLAYTSFVISNKSLCFSQPWFPHLANKDKKSTDLPRWLEKQIIYIYLMFSQYLSLHSLRTDWHVVAPFYRKKN